MDEQQLIEDFLSRIPEFKKIVESDSNFVIDENQPEEPDGPAFTYFNYVAQFVIDTLATRKNRALLKEIFAYFEDMQTFGEDIPQAVLSDVVLERLGEDKAILKKARTLMGPETLKASQAVEKKWGRA